MQRHVTPGRSAPTPAPSCTACGGALVMSHREYRGRGASAQVLRCTRCGTTVTRAPRDDASRAAPTGRSRRHLPVDEGPPTNPVLDPDLAHRLLEQLEG